MPSGNAVATEVLLRLHAWTGASGYRAAADRALRTVVPYVARYATGFARWLSAMDVSLAPIVEVAIVGAPGDPATLALVAEVRRGYRPNQVVAVAADPAASSIPLLEGRLALDGRPTASVCRRFVCRLPVTDADALREQNSRRRRPMADGGSGPTAVSPKSCRDGRPDPTGPSRVGGAADPATLVDGVRCRDARLPRRPGGRHGPGARPVPPIRPVARRSVDGARRRPRPGFRTGHVCRGDP